MELTSITLPSVAAIVGVRDEVELIERCIRHLQRLEIHIVVVDRTSSDGTEIILREMEKAGEIALIRDEEDPEKDQDFFIRGIELARSRFSPDWISIQDADEFLFSEDNVKEVLARETSDVISIPRYNACLSNRLSEVFETGGDSWIEDLDIFVQDVQLSRSVMDQDPSLRWISGKPVEKVVARTSVIRGVTMGGHQIIGDGGGILPARHSQEFVIVHVPFLTLDRFRRKADNIRRAFLRRPDMFQEGRGWHWKRWDEISSARGVDSEFNEQFIEDDLIENLRQIGVVRRVKS